MLSALWIRLGGEAVLPSMGGRKVLAEQEKSQSRTPKMPHLTV